ncbi:MAG: histone deacetylase [Desulfobacterales bacterium]
MIKREHLKQAVDSIARKNPEIGYALGELMAAGRIDVPEKQADADADFFIQFDGRPIRIRKYAYLHDGIVVLEEQLAAGYGSMVWGLEHLESGSVTSFRQMAMAARRAGLRLMVAMELDRVLASDAIGPDAGNAEELKEGGSLRRLLTEMRGEAERPLAGTVSIEREALHCLLHVTAPDGSVLSFHRFPYTLSALMQAADLNLEFFHVRFLINALVEGVSDRLLCGVADGRIFGLAYLDVKARGFQRDLEIKYIATRQASDQEISAYPRRPLKGGGAFLLACIWLLWKHRLSHLRKLVLDAEIGARGFYEAVGFVPRPRFEFVLERPDGRMLSFLWMMIRESKIDDPAVIGAFTKVVAGHVKGLRRPSRTEREKRSRSRVIAVLQSCIGSSGTHPGIAKPLAAELNRYRRRIPEAEAILAAAEDAGTMPREERHATVEPCLAVVHDRCFDRHLEKVFHLDSPRRMRFIEALLEAPELRGRLLRVPPRQATPEELKWVHTEAHVQRIAATRGRPMVAFDADTQTTEASYETACLAVGAVLELVDCVMSGEVSRAIAFVRPPGHHAEPDRAMGFCLFNNVAVAANYLLQVYGAARVMIVDIDAHHGNGTQAAFYDSDRVLFLSMHQFPAYPGTGHMSEVGIGAGEGYTINVPVGRGAGDVDFGRILLDLADPVGRAFQPDVILVSCGFDLYRHDRLAALNGTPEGYALLIRLLMDLADAVCDRRLVVVVEGGYNPKGVGRCAREVLWTLCGRGGPSPGLLRRVRNGGPGGSLKKALAFHARYWPVLEGRQNRVLDHREFRSCQPGDDTRTGRQPGRRQ